MITVKCPNCQTMMDAYDPKNWPGREPDAECPNCGALVTSLGNGSTFARTGVGFVAVLSTPIAQEDLHQ